MHRYVLMTILAALGGGMLKADAITYSVTPSAGHFTYNFTLANTGATGGSIFDLFLALPTAIGNIDTAAITTPPGWGDPAGGLLFYGTDVTPSTSFIEWSSDSSGAFDLTTGKTLSGFTFDSSLQFDRPIRYALNGSTDFGIATLPASSVPEPSTGILLVLACVSAVAWRGRLVRRRRME